MEAKEPEKLPFKASDNIALLLIQLMSFIDTDRSLNGVEKKAFVLKVIKKMVGNEAYERYSPVLDLFIDLLVKISRKEVKLFLNQSKKCFTLCK